MNDKIFHAAVYAFNTILIAGIIGVCVFTFLYTVDRANGRFVPEPQISSWNSTMCLAGVINESSGTISEVAPGIYSYTLIPRSDGSIEVWKECDASGGTQ